VVFLHRAHQHSSCHGSAYWCRIEIRNASGRDVKRAALQRGQAFAHKLMAAIDEPGFFGPVLERTPRDIVIIGLIWLPQVRGVAVRYGALLPHPVDGRAGIESAGERNTDIFTGGE